MINLSARLSALRATKEKVDCPVYLLLKDGRLFGPFKSREDAKYWCVSLDLDGYSTYDLLNPRGYGA